LIFHSIILLFCINIQISDRFLKTNFWINIKIWEGRSEHQGNLESAKLICLEEILALSKQDGFNLNIMEKYVWLGILISDSY
jgi:hypothetical protein